MKTLKSCIILSPGSDTKSFEAKYCDSRVGTSLASFRIYQIKIVQTSLKLTDCLIMLFHGNNDFCSKRHLGNLLHEI